MNRGLVLLGLQRAIGALHFGRLSFDLAEQKGSGHDGFFYSLVAPLGEVMDLITEDALARFAAPAPSTPGVSPECLTEPEAAAALCAYLTLTQRPELFVSAGWSPESVFWSRYYWFRRFANLRAASAGADQGLEQQAFQILESPFPPCNPDWSQLELLNLQAAAK
jgi:hypothetical protein